MNRSSIAYTRAFLVRRAGAGILTALALLPPLILLMVSFADGGYDTDGWWILKMGEEIARNGIPHENPFSLQPGLSIVIQQWLHDVLAWLVYAVGGFAGLDYIQPLFAALVLTCLVIALTAVSSSNMRACRLIPVCLVALGMASMYISVRPTSWTMCLMLLTAASAHLWRRKRSIGCLVPLPLIQLAAVNLQISLAPIVTLTAAAFLLPDAHRFMVVLKGGQESAGSAHGLLLACSDHLALEWPLFVAVLSMVPVYLLNPYGLDGALYLARSVGIPGYRGVISELKPSFLSMNAAVTTFFYVIFLLPVLLMVARAAMGRMAVPDISLLPTYSVLLTAGLIGYTAAVRNIWIAVLTSALMLGYLHAPYPGDRPDPTIVHHLAMLPPAAFAVSAAMLCLLTASIQADVGWVRLYIDNGSRQTWESLDSAFGGFADTAIALRDLTGRDPRIYCSHPILYNYLEWRGLKVPFDMRPEIWCEPIAKAETGDPFQRYVDSALDGNRAGYFSDMGFDLYITDTGGAKSAVGEFGSIPLAEVTTVFESGTCTITLLASPDAVNALSGAV